MINQEECNRIARTRYNLDLQGAMKRTCVTNGVPQHEYKDLEGICRALYNASSDSDAGVAGMTFTLSIAPAP